MFIWPAMPTIGGDNGVSMGGYDNGVATLKYCYILVGSKDPLNLYEAKKNGLFQIIVCRNFILDPSYITSRPTVVSFQGIT
jgi:hypothetical protein